MSASPGLRVCVYCGSRNGALPAYAEAADAVGRWIGREGGTLVYGGGRGGLMGRVAGAALAAGAQVIGIIPRALMEREVGHTGLHELHVVETMHQRKQMMAERADVFVALPGGLGTMEELFEVWTWRQLGYHDQPIGLLDVAGCYQPLLALLDRMVADGFVDAAQRALLAVSESPDGLLDTLRERLAGAGGRDDFSRT
jgi:uncharacterized protein (TIGR00730 family)